MTGAAADEPGGWDGEALLSGRPVRAVLAGRFDPLRGRLVWTGRVSGSGLETLGDGDSVTVGTSYGESPAVVRGRTLWGDLLVDGEGRPPFPTDVYDTDPDVG